MSSITLRYVASDFLKAWRLQRRNAKLVRVVAFVPLVFVFFYLLSAWSGVRAYGWDGVFENIDLLVVAALLFGLNVLTNKVLLPRRAKKFLEQQKSMQQDIVIAWSAAGLELTAANGHSRLAWGDFIRWLEDDDSVVVFQSDNLLNIVPKRTLDEGQVAELRGYLTAALGKAGRKARRP